MEKLKAYLTSALILTVLLTFTGCRARLSLPYDYLEAPFRAEIRWCEGEASFSAELRADPASRNVTLRFTAPEDMVGICVTRESGTISLICDGLSLEGERHASLLRAVDLLLLDAPLRGLCREKLSGLSVLYGRRTDPTSQIEAELWLDENTGYPKQLRQGGLTLTVISFRT